MFIILSVDLRVIL